MTPGGPGAGSPAPVDPEPVACLLVVGTGLIGTSVALAAADRGVRVLLHDRDPASVALAEQLGAGRAWDGAEVADLVVLAVPVGAVGAAAADVAARLPHATLTDVGSVKRLPQDALAAAGLGERFCGGHPVAGRERGGAAAARPDLFEGRPWVLTPTRATGVRAHARARWLAETCGAEPVWSDPDEHDAALGLVSHTAQLVASLLAARLADASDLALQVAGTGLRDTTRLAASDPVLWAGIAAANRAPVAAALTGLRTDLDALLDALSAGEEPAATAVAGLVARVGSAAAGCPASTGCRPPPTPRSRWWSRTPPAGWPSSSPTRPPPGSTSRTWRSSTRPAGPGASSSWRCDRPTPSGWPRRSAGPAGRCTGRAGRGGRRPGYPDQVAGSAPPAPAATRKDPP